MLVHYKKISSPFDASKLFFHQDIVEKVRRLIKGDYFEPKDIPFPICVEVDLVSGCNQGCRWCQFKSWGKKNVFIAAEFLKSIFKDLRAGGTKAIELVGGGESTLHPEIKEIVESAVKSGLEIGLITNGLLLPRIFSIAHKLKYIRISLDAATSETYKKTHYYFKNQAKEEKTRIIEPFLVIKENIKQLTKFIDRRKIGIAFLVTPWNYQEIESAARLAKELGVGYMVFRPANLRKDRHLKGYWEDIEKSLDAAQKYTNKNFHVFRSAVSRWNLARFKNIRKIKLGSSCFGSLLFGVIEANGNVPFCNIFRDNKKYNLGNIYNSQGNFKSIWQSVRHKKLLERQDIKKCRTICKAKDYLLVIKQKTELGLVKNKNRNDSAHVNFV